MIGWRDVLEFERTAPEWPGKDRAIRSTFGITGARYSQELNRVLDLPVAYEAEPQLVARLRRQRDRNRMLRFAQRLPRRPAMVEQPAVQGTLLDPVDVAARDLEAIERTRQVDALDAVQAQGQARATDPATSQAAARLIRARATGARVLLLEAFARAGEEGLTDEQAAERAGLSLSSEYATRCSELDRAGVVATTPERRPGRAGMERVVRTITPLGRWVLDERRAPNRTEVTP